MKYRREIDGLRAVAVLPVIFFHAGLKAFEGGFVGVDVFFVISGYLITNIILSEMNKGKFSIVNFYERRARRILPALFFVILCCLPFAWGWLLPSHLKDFSQSLTAISTFSSNVLFWYKTGYFGTAASLKPMLHTWSLAVEEQYYVLFPLLLMGLWKLRKRWIFVSLTIIAFLSLMLAQWGAYNRPSAAFFLLPTRAWELAIGALIAFCFLYKKEQAEFANSRKATSEVLGLLGLALICYSILIFDESTPFPSLYTLVPTIGAGLIIIFSTPETISGRLLSAKMMVGVGLISYSTYLWHQPLFAFARHRSLKEPSVFVFLLLSLLSIVLAYFSWRYVEQPFRDKNIFSRKKVFSLAFISTIFIASAGIAGHFTNGFDNRINSRGDYLSKINEKILPTRGLSDVCVDFTSSANCRTSDNPEILVWGDSFAMHLVDGIMASNPKAKIVQMTKGVCGPFFDVAPFNQRYPQNWGCLDFSDKVKEYLKQNDSIKYAVISSPFIQYLGYEKYKLLIDGEIHEGSVDLAIEHFLKTLDQLEEMGVQPVIFSPPPRTGENIGLCLAKAELFNGSVEDCNFDFDSQADYSVDAYRFLREIEKYYKVVYIDKFICENGVCNAMIDNSYIYRDSCHLSQQGSVVLGKK